MRRFLLGLLFIACIPPEGADAQQWTGTAALTLTGGHQTNTYLDPVLRSWNLPTDPAFLAFTPRVGLSRTGRSNRLDVAARARLYSRRSGVPQFAQGYARYRHRLSSSWTIGALGGGTRYRLGTARDSWWALPSLDWAPTSNTSFTIRGGMTRRYLSPPQTSDTRQTSGLLTLSSDIWLADRFRAQARFYWSNGQSTASDLQFGGTGGAIQGTYWPTEKWSMDLKVALERIQYDTGISVRQDRIGRVGLKTKWQMHPSVALFAQTRAAVSQTARTDGVGTDLHVSLGVRLQASRVLGGTRPTSPQRRVCKAVEKGLQIQIPYDGPGTPHVTGDFNGWALPGVPLTRSNEDTWTRTLSVAPGTYAYRIRVVDDGDRQWLDLPSYAQTADDSFGGTNGVCTAQ